MAYHVNPGPNATYASMTSQTIADITVGQTITFDTIEVESGIELETSGGVGTKIYVRQPGDFLVTFSAVCNTTSGSNKFISIWLRKNGFDIPRSNTILRITSNNQQVMSVSFVFSLALNDYLEFAMAGETTNCQIQAKPAVVAPATPVQPAVPSIVVSMVQVS